MRILVAEDNQDMREALVLMFEQAGWEVVAADDGSKALFIYDQYRDIGKFFDLLLLDIRMPLINGIAVGIEVRKIEATGSTPRAALVYLTGKDDVKDPEGLKEVAFADDFILKPVDSAVLMTKCDAALQKMAKGN